MFRKICDQCESPIGDKDVSFHMGIRTENNPNRTDREFEWDRSDYHEVDFCNLSCAGLYITNFGQTHPEDAGMIVKELDG
jgi:hypothetical protein